MAALIRSFFAWRLEVLARDDMIAGVDEGVGEETEGVEEGAESAAEQELEQTSCGISCCRVDSVYGLDSISFLLLTKLSA